MSKKPDFKTSLEVYHRAGNTYLRMRTHRDPRTPAQLGCRSRFADAAALAKLLLPVAKAANPRCPNLWRKIMSHLLTDVVVHDPRTGEMTVKYEKIKLLY